MTGNKPPQALLNIQWSMLNRLSQMQVGKQSTPVITYTCTELLNSIVR